MDPSLKTGPIGCCYSTPYNLDAGNLLNKKGISFKAVHGSSVCCYSALDKQLAHNSPVCSLHPENAHHISFPLGPTPSYLNSDYTYAYLNKIHFKIILLFTTGISQYTKQRPSTHIFSPGEQGHNSHDIKMPQYSVHKKLIFLLDGQEESISESWTERTEQDGG